MFGLTSRFNRHAGTVMLETSAVFICVVAYIMFVQQSHPEHSSIFSGLSVRQALELLGLAAIGLVIATTASRLLNRPRNASAAPHYSAGIEQAAKLQAQKPKSGTTQTLGSNEHANDAEQRFNLVLTTFDIATFYCDRDHRYTWSHNFMGKPDDLLGKKDTDILPEDTAAILTGLKQKALDEGGMQSGEMSIDLGHEVRTYSVQVAPRRDGLGNIVGTLAVSCDVTEKAIWQKHLVMMMREVNHRARNILSIVTSICGQTAMNAANIAEYKEKITGRVMSLAASMDVITRDDWGFSSLKKLITAQFAVLHRGETKRINVQGDDVLINSKAVQNIGLAVHELATNAKQHGALSDPEGQVDLVISTLEHAGQSSLELTWTEKSAQKIGSPVSRGFGLKALEAILATELDGSCELYWETTGLRCVLMLPGTVLGSGDSDTVTTENRRTIVESMTGERISH